jgi:tRNA pseudouridine55 synthase
MQFRISDIRLGSGFGVMIEGVFAIYKEEGMTSHDVVRAIRRLTGQRRVGHAGTLDPCATGVLVVGIGRAATKTLKLVVGTDKEYVTRVKLGWRSTTDDREGDKEPAAFPPMPSEAQIRQARRVSGNHRSAAARVLRHQGSRKSRL